MNKKSINVLLHDRYKNSEIIKKSIINNCIEENITLDILVNTIYLHGKTEHIKNCKLSEDNEYKIFEMYSSLKKEYNEQHNDNEKSNNDKVDILDDLNVNINFSYDDFIIFLKTHMLEYLFDDEYEYECEYNHNNKYKFYNFEKHDDDILMKEQLFYFEKDIYIHNKHGINNDSRGTCICDLNTKFYNCIIIHKGHYTINELAIKLFKLKSHKHENWYELFNFDLEDSKNNNYYLKVDHGF